MATKCAGCGEIWPCSDSKRRDISGIERAKHTRGKLDDLDTLRVCHFRPYAKGQGPAFVLCTWSTGHYDTRGQSIIGYRLNMITPDTWSPLDGTVYSKRQRVTLFEAEDFAGSPLHADDSDDTMRALMTFLTLQPGDTDAEYFASDTDLQREYREAHAEALAGEVERRFGEGR